MKRLLLYIPLLLLVIACGKNKEVGTYAIQGTAVGEGTMFLFSTDESYRELSSANSNGSFAMAVPLANSTILTLVLPDGKDLALFAEPGVTATLQADTLLKSGWSIKGGRNQELHDSISRVLDATADVGKHKEIITDFTKRYPTSEVTVELFRHYLIEIPEPDNDYLRKAIPRLSGTLQDHWYFASMKKLLDTKNGNVKHRSFPSFNLKTINEENVTPNTYSGKYLLVNFWATWNEDCRKKMKRLNGIKDAIKSESFAILNIALDGDTTHLRETIANDTIIGDNAYDTKGLNSSVTSIFNIASLPYSVLVTPYKRIAEYDLKLDSSAVVLIDSLTQKHDKRKKK